MVRRWMRLVVVLCAGALAAVAGTVLAVAVNVATGGSAEWFPLAARHPVALTFAATAVVAVAGLAVWQAQRWYELGLDELVPAVRQLTPETVSRPDEVRQVVRALRRQSGGSVGITTAVHGAGGFGKTTVAAMVGADRRVLRRFGGRVYWVTLGRDLAPAALAERVNDLVRQVDTEKAAPFTDTRQLTTWRPCWQQVLGAW